MLLGMAHPSYGRAEVLGEDAAAPAAAKPAPASPIWPRAIRSYRWMTIRQAVRSPARFTPAGTSRCWSRSSITSSFRRSGGFAGSPAASRPRWPWRWPWPPIRKLLILDDPTLGLDTVVRRDFLESLIQIIQRRGRTILFSSHILGDVERVADRIGILVDGVLRVDCPTDHFKESVRKVLLEFDGEPPAVARLSRAW